METTIVSYLTSFSAMQTNNDSDVDCIGDDVLSKQNILLMLRIHRPFLDVPSQIVLLTRAIGSRSASVSTKPRKRQKKYLR